jgi:hypothetical protein
MDVSNFKPMPRGIKPQRGCKRQTALGSDGETFGDRGGMSVATQAKCYAYAFTPAFSTIVGTIR